MRSAVHLLSLLVVALTFVSIESRADVAFPIDRSVFERELTVLTTPAHLPERPNFPYAGSEVRIRATILPGDNVAWFHQGQLMPAETTAELRLNNVSEADAGAYWAQITRDGYVHETMAVTVSIATPPTRSVVDTSFTNRFDHTNQTWDYSFTVIDRNGRLGFIRYPGVFFTGSFGWMEADGSSIQNVFAWEYPNSNLGGFSGLLQDGSYLVNGTGKIVRVGPDGSQAPLLYLGEHLLEPNGWALLENDDLLHTTNIVLLRIAPDGSERWLYRSSDYGFDYIHFTIPLNDGTARMLLSGAQSDEIGTVTNAALVIEADGTIATDVARMLLKDRPELVHQADGSWVSVSSESVLHFNADGTLHSDRSLGEWSRIQWSAARDGYLYGAWPEIGILRLSIDSLELDDSFYALLPPNTNLAANTPLLTEDGSLYFAARFASVDLHETRLITKLDTKASAAGLSPVVNITVQETPVGGEPVKIVGTVIGEGPLTYEWINLDQPLTTSQTGPVFYIDRYASADTGRYMLKVTGATGVGYSNVWDLRPTTPPLMRNLSGRARVTSPDRPMLAGFVVEQRGLSSPLLPPPFRYLLLRGVGPALTDFGITTPLQDPLLTLKEADGVVIASNDDWQPITAGEGPLAASAAAFPLPIGSHDAQLFLTRSSGVNVLEIASKPDDSGIALAEIYLLGDTDLPVDLSNLSLRGRTGPGDDILTGGFVIDDSSGLGRSIRLLLRAVGPGLDPFGVDQTCDDPVLKLFDQQGTLIASSDDWGDHTPAAQLTTLATTLGAFALHTGSADAALEIELSPGVYTAQVSSATDEGGEVLLELYRAPVE